MKCTRVEKFLPLHVAGDLAGGRRARAVAKHLTTCAACRHIAAEYDARRELWRAEAATLPAEFDGAFYEGIRNSVLAQIRRDHTLAPPSLVRYPSFFNGRFAYAASLALLVVLAAALSLHSYMRAAGDVTTQEMIAKANRTSPFAPPYTPQRIQETSSAEQNSRTSVELAGEATSEGVAARGTNSSLPKRRKGSESLRSESQPGVLLTGNAPSQVKRNPLAPDIGVSSMQAMNSQGLTTGGVNSGGATTAPAEVSRIEIQTSDPNIRIIWLAPVTDSAQPLK